MTGDMLAIRRETSPDEETAIAAVPRSRLARQALVGTVLALVLPVLLHLVHADFIVLGVAWLAFAGLLTAGRGLLDRLVLGGVFLVGVMLAAGLVFSLWPWGLAPVPLGIVLLLGVTGVATATRRTFSLSWQVEPSDLVIVASVGIAFWLAYRPLSGLDQLQRLRFSAVVLDRMAHYALFESIQRLGGFAFEHQAAARLSVQTPTEVVYPQGSHFVLSVVNNFLSSSTSSPPGPALLDRYFLLVLAVYALGIGAVAWAARWIAGPESSALGRVLVTVLATSFMLFGPTAQLIIGFDSQLFGMAMLVLAAALVVRPAQPFTEHILLASALTIAVFYSYNVYGAIAGLGFLFSAMLYRLPLVRRWRVTLGIAVPAAVIALLPSYLTVAGGFDIRKQALTAGGHMPMSSILTPLVAAIAILPILSTRARRDPVWLGVAALLGVSVVVLGLFGLYGSAHAGGSYYYGKLLGASYMCMVALLGLLGLVLARPAPTRSEATGAEPRRAAPRNRVAPVLASLLAVAALLVLSGYQQRLPGTTNGSKPVTYVPLAYWSSGKAINVNWRIFAHLAATGQLPSTQPTIVVADRSRSQTWGNSVYVAAMSGQLGEMRGAMGILGGVTKLTPQQSAMGAGKSAALVALIRAAAQASPGAPRIVVADPALSADITTALQKAPAVKATVVTDPGLKRG
jgi:hypothetical protein